MCVYVPTIRLVYGVYSYSLFVSNSSQDSDSIYSATCVELHPRFLCDLWRPNPEFGIGAHQISLCSSPTHTPFWNMCKRHYWFLSKLAVGAIRIIGYITVRRLGSRGMYIILKNQTQNFVHIWMIRNMYNGPILLGLFLPLLECASRFYFDVFYPTTIFLLSTLFAVL